MTDFSNEIAVLKDITLEYVDAADLDRYRKIFDIQIAGFNALDQLDASASPCLPEHREFTRGVPLIRQAVLEIDAPWATGQLYRMGELLYGLDVSEDQFKADLKEQLVRAGWDLNGLLVWAAYGRNNEFSRKFSDLLDLDSEDLRVWVRESIRPWYWKLADLQTDPVKYEEWSHGYCPICGNSPVIAVLKEEEGFRFLSCNMCNFSWRTHRLRCGVCGNTDEKKLRYLFTEHESPHRAHVCDGCKSYLLTIDTRKWKFERRIYPRIEHIVMLFLDALAQREGFTSSPVEH